MLTSAPSNSDFLLRMPRKRASTTSVKEIKVKINWIEIRFVIRELPEESDEEKEFRARSEQKIYRVEFFLVEGEKKLWKKLKGDFFKFLKTTAAPKRITKWKR